MTNFKDTVTRIATDMNLYLDICDKEVQEFARRIIQEFNGSLELLGTIEDIQDTVEDTLYNKLLGLPIGSRVYAMTSQHKCCEFCQGSGKSRWAL